MGPKMPTVSIVCESQTDTSSAIRNSLTAAFNNGSHHGLDGIAADSSDIQNQLTSTAKLALLSDIDYEETKSPRSTSQDNVKAKYTTLLPTTTSTANTVPPITIASNPCNVNGKLGMYGSSTTDKSTNGTDNEKKSGAELPQPKNVLFSREKVQIGWNSTNRKWLPGLGMINVGNTCYLNSTLQALFHVPAFANWLVSDSLHRETCEEKTGMQNGCIICAMGKTLLASQQATNQPFRPYFVYSKLKLVCKHLVLGHQEDAHEFLRYLMEAMEKAYLARFTKGSQLDQYSQETTPINQILGGYLKTSVRCLACNHVSVTFQHFEDLLLDIRKANTLDEALDLYFARERLEDMGYKCESCKKKVSATKQFSLERAPISLCIQLKRFSIMGNKLNKHIAIRQQLNLSKYASRRHGNDQLNYRLVSMITHLGASQNCGHYTAIGYAGTGNYYQFDDSYVRGIPLQNVLNTNAYIIFYELDTTTEKWQSARSVTVMDTNKMQNSYDERPISYVERDISDAPVRNNISQTVTSKAFIGPLLPNKPTTSPNNSDKNVAYTPDVASKTNGRSSESFIPAIDFTPITDTKLESYPESPTSTTNGINNDNDKTNESNSINTNYVQSNGYHKTSKKQFAESDDEEQNDANDTELAQIADKFNSKQLPNMPKLDMSSGLADRHDTARNDISPNKVPLINGNFHGRKNGRTIDIGNGGVECDSSSNDSNYTPSKKKSVMANSIKALTTTNDDKNHRLVPYEDSEYDSGAESPPTEVNTKAGPFQVTTTNRSELSHSSSAFARNTNTERTLSNGANLLVHRRESDGNVTIKTAASSAQTHKRPNEWHGNETASKLMKFSHRGYGAAVTTWNGQQSCMEKEVNDEKNDELKRQTLSANDAEIDRGHKKKTSTKSLIGRDNPGYNPFQECQTLRNAWTVSNGSNGNANTAANNTTASTTPANASAPARPFSKPQTYRQNPHKKFTKHSFFGNRRFNHNNNYNRR